MLDGQQSEFYPRRTGQPRLMVDIGANIGVFALVALARGHFVVAFEPVKRYASAVLVLV